MENILEVHDLGMTFDNQVVFSGLNFQLTPGSKTAILGENGSGKTTLIRIIMGILTPTSGSITLGDVDNRPIKIGYVPQFRNIDKDYPLSLRSFIELNAPLVKNAAYKKRVADVLAKTELTEISDYRLGRASGGQKQRAYLAQALLEQPDLIILDEATASLDPVAKETLLNVLDKLNKSEGLTILFTTHDIPLAHEHMDDYVFFDSGEITTGKMRDFNEREVLD
ncbi:ABC-type Mn Zn transport system, ATPase component [Amylolactobacillus amylotrophicus DSM 20534]|uniref:ABC-type Mn Zn transport system, ATPase component n=3 Tax=Amylolactobacillus TaxID=2767876 RepID=A0A0R1YHD8_9LACO|nr:MULTISPECIES: ATP-binding cassette domain-containing protein [Amylolactobacillus]KRK37763.1 ABC-type Mn Zn transport system, ATPase component [Amylolactobacillus amylotrophicus DSM 20534]KRM41551.1 ABC-type Mn Zn transport system, ATPase component [Amylolactobacillus amylophilus DSM 20533 = JCM 1125]GED80781.1 ABC transporter ATP-binding protein [Amylolactobacillus amylophilus]